MIVDHASATQRNASLAAWLNEISEPELETVLHAAVASAARGLSSFVRRPIRLNTFQVEAVPVTHITRYAGDPETGMVGIYLLLEGDLRGQAILILPLAGAMTLVDALMNIPPGTAANLGDLERSALAEAGNVMVSYFLNTIASFLKRPRPLYPSPPAVMVDMLGAILDVITTPVAAESDQLLIITSGLTTGRLGPPHSEGADQDPNTLQVRFWVLPDAAVIARSSTSR